MLETGCERSRSVVMAMLAGPEPASGDGYFLAPAESIRST
jgi:hypothetical protein